MIKVTEDDFFLGLFAALVSKGQTSISIRDDHFDKSVAEVFNKLLESSSKWGLDIRFRIRLHKFHDDSILIRNAVYSAAQRGLISLDNPEYQDIRFKIKPEQANQILQSVPGGKELFSELADDFLRQYNLAGV
jgi:hypothetical protein